MSQSVVKALDSNFMEMMTAHIGKTITDAYVDDEVKTLNELLAKKEKVETLEKDNASLRSENATLSAKNEALASALEDVKPYRDRALKAEADSARLGGLMEGMKSQLVDQRAQIAALTAAMQAAESYENKEVVNQDTGCEIDVLRDGGDKIRSLRVRYV